LADVFSISAVRADQHGFGYTFRAVSANIASDFAAAVNGQRGSRPFRSRASTNAARSSAYVFISFPSQGWLDAMAAAIVGDAAVSVGARKTIWSSNASALSGQPWLKTQAVPFPSPCSRICEPSFGRYGRSDDWLLLTGHKNLSSAVNIGGLSVSFLGAWEARISEVNDRPQPTHDQRSFYRPYHFIEKPDCRSV